MYILTVTAALAVLIGKGVSVSRQYVPESPLSGVAVLKDPQKLPHRAITVLQTDRSTSERYLMAHRPPSSPLPLAGTFYLYPGWIPGLWNDLSDIQWRTYRGALPALCGFLLLFAATSRGIARASPGYLHYTPRHNAFRLVAGVLFLVALHGAYAVHVLTAIALHFSLGTAAAGLRRVGPFVIWGVPVTLWLAARLSDGLPFSMLGASFEVLDAWAGPVRWYTGFNLVALRLISWGMDLHWTRLRLRGFLPPFGAPGTH